MIVLFYSKTITHAKRLMSGIDCSSGITFLFCIIPVLVSIILLCKIFILSNLFQLHSLTWGFPYHHFHIYREVERLKQLTSIYHIHLDPTSNNFHFALLVLYPSIYLPTYVFEWIDSVEYSTGRYVPFLALHCSLSVLSLFFLDQISKGSSFLFSKNSFSLNDQVVFYVFSTT